MSQDHILFSTVDLATRDGFDDGHLVDAVVSQVCAMDGIDPATVPTHDVLAEVIERFVVPALDQRVHTARWMTGHNPVRLRSVDGLLVEGDDIPLITPEIVFVSRSDIEEVTRAVARRGPLPPSSRPPSAVAGWVGSDVQVDAAADGVLASYTGRLVSARPDGLLLVDGSGAEVWVERDRVLAVMDIANTERGPAT
jgi:hypothetical protein